MAPRFSAFLFLSTPSARRATPYPPDREQVSQISIHALREEGDIHKGHPRRSLSISIHALREEGDAYGTARTAITGYFYPRPPRGGRPTSSISLMAASIFLSTPSARRATASLVNKGGPNYISIHALREEGDALADLGCTITSEFLSTPSARRATFLSKICFT